MDDVQEAAAVEQILRALPSDASEEDIVQATRGYRRSAVNAAMIGVHSDTGDTGSLTNLEDVAGTPGPGKSPVGDDTGTDFTLRPIVTQADLDAILTAVAAVEWNPLELAPGWAAHLGRPDAAPPRYRLLLNNSVFVEGLVEHLAGGLSQVDQGTPIAQLPSEASPDQTLVLLLPSDGTYPVRIDLLGDGTIVFMGYFGSGAVVESWTWTVKTTDANTAGQVGVNAATWAAVTSVHLNEKTTANHDIQESLNRLEPGSLVQLQMKTDANRRGRYEVSGQPVDQGTWRALPVTHVDSAGTPPGGNAETIVTLATTTPVQRAKVISLTGLSYSVGNPDAMPVRQALNERFA
jgi:hypothetical protein